jgi:hypothetical protein
MTLGAALRGHPFVSHWALLILLSLAEKTARKNVMTPTSDLVDTVRSVAIEAHISSGPSGGLFI